jgi:CelD/BcsL family acetyltransferase involved in cellulose biosynthesis
LTANPPGPFSPGERALDPQRLNDITTEVVGDLEGVRALTRDYEHLYEVTCNTLPFATQEWHLAWGEHFLSPDEHIREQPLFHVLRRANGECVAIVPLILSQRRFGPLRVGSVALVGADPGLSEIRSALIKPGYEWLTVRAVHERLAQIPEWDWIQWSGMNAPLAQALEGESAPKRYDMTQDFVLDLPPTWEKFRAGLKRNIRESLRHCYNSLKREGHSFEFVVAREPGEVRVALGRFFELHGMRAQMTNGARHPNLFATAHLQGFLHDLCGRFAARDAVRVFQLRIGGEIVASRVAFVLRDTIYLYYSGFDPSWARYSVMTTTFAEALKYAIANEFRVVNLSVGAEQSKLRWNPRLIEYSSALVEREFLRSRILSSAYRLTQSRHAAGARILRSLLHSRKWN